MSSGAVGSAPRDMSNPNDQIRDGLLRHLYKVHQRARSPRMASVGIRDLHKAMKESAGYKQKEVGSNLDYLIQRGWVNEVVEERKFTTARGTTQSSPRVTYKISDVGIDHLEGASVYERPPTGARLDITNIQGVTVVGDGNVVNAAYADLSRVLGVLREAVLGSEMADEAKLEATSDIDALQSQLQKPHPDPSVIKKIWTGVEKVVTAGELAELAAKASALLVGLLS